MTTLDGAALEIEGGGGGGEDEEAREEPALEAAVAAWLSYYGPVDRGRLAGALGLGDPLLPSVLDDLAGEQAVVVGPLVEGAERDQVCEAENLESLLRMARADATPAFQALPVDQLPLFLGRLPRPPRARGDPRGPAPAPGAPPRLRRPGGAVGDGDPAGAPALLPDARCSTASSRRAGCAGSAAGASA